MNEDRATRNCLLPLIGVHWVNLFLRLHQGRVVILLALFADALAQKGVIVAALEDWIPPERSQPAWNDVGSPTAIAVVVQDVAVQQVLLGERVKAQVRVRDVVPALHGGENSKSPARTTDTLRFYGRDVAHLVVVKADVVLELSGVAGIAAHILLRQRIHCISFAFAAAICVLNSLGNLSIHSGRCLDLRP